MKQEVKEALLKVVEVLTKAETFHVDAQYEWGNIDATKDIYDYISIHVLMNKSTDPRKDKK